MDEAVALVLSAPAVALALWAIAFVGSAANSQARTEVAAELAAAAAVRAEGPVAATTAERIALGATLGACARTDVRLVQIDEERTAAVTVVCQVPGPLTNSTVCATGFAQQRPAATGRVLDADPACG